MATALRKKKDTERKQRTRNKLLDAAGRVFARAGYHKTAISDIVSEAGVGQGTFYRHFASKRELFEGLFDRLLDQLLAELTPMTVRLPVGLHEYRSASLSAVTRMAGVAERNRDLVLLCLREGSSIDPAFERKLSQTYDRFAALAQFYLDHAIARGFARPCRTALVSQALVGIALRMIDRWLGDRLGDMTLEDAIEELVDFAFSGFGLGPKGDCG